MSFYVDVDVHSFWNILILFCTLTVYRLSLIPFDTPSRSAKSEAVVSPVRHSPQRYPILIRKLEPESLKSQVSIPATPTVSAKAFDSPPASSTISH